MAPLKSVVVQGVGFPKSLDNTPDGVYILPMWHEASADSTGGFYAQSSTE